MEKNKDKYINHIISTQDVSGKDIGAFWKETIDDLHCKLDTSWEEDQLPDAALHRQEAGNIQTVYYRTSPGIYQRTVKNIREDPCDDFEFLAPTSSSYHGEQQGRSFSFGPGQFCLLDYSREVTIAQTDAQKGILFKIPRYMLEHRIADPQAACGVVINGHKGIAKVTLNFLKSIATEQNFTRQEYLAVCQQLLDLFALSLQSNVDFHMSETTARTATLRHMKSFIQENISNETLGTPMIALNFGMSPRYVQKLFKSADLSIAGYINDRRLELARVMLLSPLHQQKTITEIAFSSGFSSSSYFSRSFRQKFDVSPRELRQQSPPEWLRNPN
ncbi:MAG TPA: helix-turn-helix domain-containing protein [Sphingomonadales bacterium]|nr:helix-turn-helix domain-containing protein [Sphingomonadales bacterium]